MTMSTPLIINQPIASEGAIHLSWTGGEGPFQVERCNDLNNPVFVPAINPTLKREATLDAVSSMTGYFRVRGELYLLALIGNVLVWFAPELT